MHSASFLTTSETAAELGVSVRDVARLVKRELLTPAMKLPGLRGAFLFDPATVSAYADERSE